jgi:hypothetical protein
LNLYFHENRLRVRLLFARDAVVTVDRTGQIHAFTNFRPKMSWRTELQSVSVVGRGPEP